MSVCGQYNPAASAASVSIDERTSCRPNLLPRPPHSSSDIPCCIDGVTKVLDSEKDAPKVEHWKGSDCSCRRGVLGVTFGFVFGLSVWYGSGFCFIVAPMPDAFKFVTMSWRNGLLSSGLRTDKAGRLLPVWTYSYNVSNAFLSCLFWVSKRAALRKM